jgi:hypothetical protein
MKSILKTVSIIILFTSVALVPRTGQCFYNAGTGRWLSRDPMGESGGLNVFAAVKNEPTDLADVLGLDYHEYIKYQSWESVEGTYGVSAFTGRTDGRVGYPTPQPLSPVPDMIRENASKCCAKVESAQRVDVDVLTVLPNNHIGMLWPAQSGTLWTDSGYEAVQGHEARRREVYKKAYDAYIAPIQGTGSIATKCKVCRQKKGEAATLLSKYLSDNQREGISKYNQWVAYQTAQVGKENDHWVTYDHIDVGLNWTHTVPNPPALAGIPCPTSD